MSFRPGKRVPVGEDGLSTAANAPIYFEVGWGVQNRTSHDLFDLLWGWIEQAVRNTARAELEER